MKITIKKEMVFLLSVWFVIYVVYDITTTYWLINNTAVGISGEQNPLGRLAFLYGLSGLLIQKFAGFGAITAAVIIMDNKLGMRKVTKSIIIKDVIEIVLLALIGVSLIGALVNWISILEAVFHL